MNTTTKPSVLAEHVVLPVDLRDYFAAKALAGLIAEPPWHAGTYPSAAAIADIPESPAQDVFAVAAYRIADAMLAERAKAQP